MWSAIVSLGLSTFFVGISSWWFRGGDGGKTPPFLGKIVDIEVFKAGDVMGQLWPDILAYGGHGGRSMWSAIVSLGLSTFSWVFLQGGVGVAMEVRRRRFLEKW